MQLNLAPEVVKQDTVIYPPVGVAHVDINWTFHIQFGIQGVVLCTAAVDLLVEHTEQGGLGVGRGAVRRRPRGVHERERPGTGHTAQVIVRVIGQRYLAGFVHFFKRLLRKFNCEHCYRRTVVN